MSSHAEARTPSTKSGAGLRGRPGRGRWGAVFERVDLGGRQGLIDGEQGENRGQSFWRASSDRARWAGQQNVFPAGLGAFKGAWQYAHRARLLS